MTSYEALEEVRKALALMMAFGEPLFTIDGPANYQRICDIHNDIVWPTLQAEGQK